MKAPFVGESHKKIGKEIEDKNEEKEFEYKNGFYCINFVLSKTGNFKIQDTFITYQGELKKKY